MAYAHCENGSCEKDSWWLQKPPSEYSSGGPKCPECGTTRVQIGEPSDPSEPQEAEPAQEPETRPAPAEEPGSDGSNPGLQTQQEALQTGAQVGEMVAGLNASNPEEKAQTQGKLMTALGSTVASMGQKMASKQMEEIDRAKNADDSNIKAVEDYVNCPKCDTQITNLPAPGTQFRCPGCNELLESQ